MLLEIKPGLQSAVVNLSPIEPGKLFRALLTVGPDVKIWGLGLKILFKISC